MIYIYSIMLLVIAFFIYWYIRFKKILPLQQRIENQLDASRRLKTFVSSVLSSNLFDMNNYINLLNMIFVKLNSTFPETSAYIFENDAKNWSYIRGINNLKENLIFSKINEALNNFKEEIKLEKNTELVPKKNKNAIFISVGISDRRIVSVIISNNSITDELMNCAEFILMVKNFLSNIYKGTEQIKNENKKLKNEIDAVVREFENQGSRLIKKSREAKLVYEGITSFTSNIDNPIKYLMELVYKYLNPLFVVYFSYDDKVNSLTPYSFFPESIKSVKPVDINDHNSVIVKSFTNKNILYIYDDKETDDILKENDIKTAIISPIYTATSRFGVLLIAIQEGKNIISDDIKLVEMISEELAIMVNLFELYNKLSSDTVNLANLNRIKDDFLATVNHEIKTPLTTIKGFVSVMLNGEAGNLNEQQMMFLKMVDDATDRLINIVTNLLDISKLNSISDFELESCDITELIDNSISSLKSKAYAKKIKIKFDRNTENSFIMGDRHWLVQAITNLIDNAIKYSKEETEINIRLYDRGSFTVFEVSDNGIGIDEEDKKHIFEKFYRSRETMLDVEGNGLGLSITKTIIEKHNGKIWFESEKGKGSKFYFALLKAK
jgi:signal transduction histidine kinase